MQFLIFKNFSKCFSLPWEGKLQAPLGSEEMIDENELNLIDEEEASGLSWARVEVHRDKSHWIPFRSFEARFES